MTTQFPPSPKKTQCGVASLFTAVILIIGATLILFTSAQLAKNQISFSSSTYRTSQALEAAQAGIDQGISTFNLASQTIDSSIVAPTAIAVESAVANNCSFNGISGPNQITGANGYYYFVNDSGVNDRCNANNESDQGTLYSVGYSDDCEARREISVCIATVDRLRAGQGPQQPLVTRGAVGGSGNARIMNRLTNVSMWSGGTGTVQGSAFRTFLRPSDTSEEDYTIAELLDGDDLNSTPDNAQPVSNNTSGFGLDVVVNDPTLSDLGRDEMWGMFFADEPTEYAEFANNPLNADGNMPESLDGGYYWLGDTPTSTTQWDDPPDTTYTLQGNFGSLVTDSEAEYRSDSKPVVLVVNGNLDIQGASTNFYGVIYVRGTITVNGGPHIWGSVIAEDQSEASIDGSFDLIYARIGGEGGDPVPFDPTAGVMIPGSWRDW